MNFPYHTESISQHVHHFKPIQKFWKKINYFPRRGGGGEGGTPFAENSAKITNLIFEPFPYLDMINIPRKKEYQTRVLLMVVIDQRIDRQ